MKFVISSSVLFNSLQIINRVINSKNTMPILENFLFKIEGNTLTLTASDGDATLVMRVALLEAEGEGTFVVPAKTLLDPVKELSDQPLRFEVDDENLQITIYFQNGKYSFMGVNGKEYPQKTPMSADADSFVIDSKALLNGITRTFFAIASDELRPIMNGIYVDVFPEEVVFVASDSHKLVRSKNFSVKAGMKASFVVPKKPASILKSILPKETGDVTVSFDEKNALFKLDSLELTCRLIEGRFPNYAAVIPVNNTNKVIVDRLSLMNVLRRVAVFANAGTQLIKLQISNNQIVISSQDLDFSTTAIENISCNYSGESISIGFKASFFIEILNSITSSEVILELADASRPGLILPIDNMENEDVLILLMPMMLTD